MNVLKNTAAPELGEVLAGELCTFSVMHRILNTPCETIVTDGARLLMVFSARPYPVWVYMPDDASREELERCWQTMLEHFPPREGHSFNMKAAHATYMRRRAEESGLCLRVTTNMLAYACKALLPAHKRVPGCLYAAKVTDLDTCAAWTLAMHEETGVDRMSPEDCRAAARKAIEAARLFLWKNGAGESCAICSVSHDGEMMGVGLVYTPPEKRRQGYAANLVHDVTRAILAQHKLPTLYTDADYAASNACYTRLGYERRGGLTTLAWGAEG